MGMWFLATAFSTFLSAIIAQFTGIGEGGEGGGSIPVPSETVDIYGNVFGLLAAIGLASGAFCLILSPILKRWMHEEENPPEVSKEEPDDSLWGQRQQEGESPGSGDDEA